MLLRGLCWRMAEEKMGRARELAQREDKASVMA